MPQQLGRMMLEAHDGGGPGGLAVFRSAEGRYGPPGPGVSEEAALAYELRTLLGIITLVSGNLDLLYERLSDDQRRKMIWDLRTYTRKLNDLIDDVLALRSRS